MTRAPFELRTSIPARMLVIAMVLTALTSFAACSDDTGHQRQDVDASSQEPRPRGNSGIVAADPTEAPSTIDVRLKEYEIRMPAVLKPGSHLMRVTNDGTEPHGLTVSGNGMDLQLPTSVQPGETQSLPIDLAPGTYRVICPVDGHADRGMSVDVTVSE